MINKISIYTKFGWISAFENNNKITKIKFGKVTNSIKSKVLKKFKINLINFLNKKKSKIRSPYQVKGNKIQKTSKIFEEFYQEISELDIVGDIRHKGMLMGIELVKNKIKKSPIHPKKSINKIFFEEGKKQGIYLRTLGNIVMLVPPLAISEKELRLLLKRTISTIKATKSQLV